MRDAAGLLRRLLGLALGVVLLALAVLAGTAWRLEQGPADVTAAVRWLARVAAPGVTVGQVTAVILRGPEGRVLRLDATELARPPQPDEPGGTVRHGVVDLALGALLAGRVRPQVASLDGVRAQVPRGGGGAGPSPLLAGLRRVSLSDVAVDWDGVSALRIRDAAGELVRSGGGLAGRLSGTAQAGGASVQVDIQGTGAAAGGTLHVETSAFSPAAWAAALPALTPLVGLDAAVTLHGDVTLDAAMQPVRGALHADAGPGTLLLPAKHGGVSPGRFSAITLDAEGTPDAVTLKALRLTLAPPSGNLPTNVVLSGTATQAAGRFTARLAVDLDRLAAADLGALWPAGVGGGSRDWLTENITAGGVHDGHFNLTLTGTVAGEDLDVTQAGGGLVGEDLTLWWLRPVPPIEHVRASMVWQNPDAMLISTTGGVTVGHPGPIAMRPSSIRITGLAANHQVGFITADLAAPLGAVVTLLSHPRLQLLSKHPLPITAVSGAVTDHLTVKLPLEANVDIDQIPIHSAGQVTDAHVGGIVAGRDLDAGQLAVDVTNDGLTLNGTAELDHVPGKLAVEMDFRDGPPAQAVLHAAAALRATEREARAAGLSALGLRGGAMAVGLDYTELRRGTATLLVNADLTAGRFDTLGWSKPAGAAGRLQARALLDRGRLVGLDGIRAEAPGLSVVARSDMVAGRPALVHIERAEVGRSSLAGTVALPQHDGDPYRVTLTGRQLDLEGRWQGDDAGSAASHPSEPGTPYVVDLRFERVLLAHNGGLGPVTLTAAGDGRRLVSARLSAGGAARVEASLTPAGGERHVRLEALDLGALLRETDLATELTGGALSLDATYDDRQADSPLEGTAELRNFKLRGAPVVAKVLQGVTVYGLAEALSGPGLALDRLAAPFRLTGPVLEVRDARAVSSSLGFTATGRFDFGRKTVDLHGAIVPAYFFNALPGRIPLLGRLFRTGQGTGLFAANYALRGALTEPSVSINPLSALAPGVTRRLFDLFD